jgi:hypothetical protein
MSNSLRSLLKLLLPVVIILLIGCGGGGGGDNPGPAPGPAPTTSVTISGTVSGTDICIYDDTVGGARGCTTATGTGTSKTFSIGLPVPGTYRLYLKENAGMPDETIYPVYQGGTNVFAFDSSVPSTLNLGFVHTVTGYAVPTVGILGTGVTAKPENRSVPPAISSSVFTQLDIVGAWQVFGLCTKNSLNSWFRGVINVNGSGTMTWISSTTYKNGAPVTLDNDTLSVISSGFISSSTNAFLGTITRDKKMILATGTAKDSSSCLYVMLKEEKSNYILADLAGAWRTQMLVTGDSPQYTGWVRGPMTISTLGVATTTFVDRNGNTQTGPGTLAIATDGSITSSSVSSFYGFLSSDGNTLVYGMNDGGGGYSLSISHKVDTLASYALSDLNGYWYGNILMTSDVATDNEWERARVDIASGTYTIVDSVSPNGSFSGSATVALSTAGVFSVAADPPSLGYVNPGKNLIIATQTDNAIPDWTFIILLKQ